MSPTTRQKAEKEVPLVGMQSMILDTVRVARVSICQYSVWVGLTGEGYDALSDYLSQSDEVRFDTDHLVVTVPSPTEQKMSQAMKFTKSLVDGWVLVLSMHQQRHYADKEIIARHDALIAEQKTAKEKNSGVLTT